jgi:NhaP-type Na+/H+ or K+/H+ antiporter
VTTNQVLLGVGLILLLAVGSQVLASLLRVPALIILLPAGFTAGAITTDVNPQRLLGAAFQPLVSLAVAVILYDAGMSLDLRKLRGHTRRVVARLILIGVPVTLAFGAAFAGLLLGMSRQAAVMTGTILVVSGPTVVGPLLAFIRPTERLQRVLSWEGSLIDPVGGLLGAVVFHAVVASTHRVIGYQFGQFMIGIGVGLAGGLAGTALLWLLLRKLRLGEVLGTSAQLATVVAVAAGCDILREDSGLISAIIMGLAVANLRGFDVPARRPFFETLVQLIIGVLFIAISATVTPASLRHLILPSLALITILVLIARPLVALLATLRTDMTAGERAFTGWMAPRGIIAAATASTFSAGLAAHHIGGAGKILPVTFLVIVVTVALYGEDDFNALGSTVLQGSVEGQVYRLAARLPSHGVVAPYTGGEVLFGPHLTRYEVGRRYADGARIRSLPADCGALADGNLLFLVRADGTLAPVTSTGPPEPLPGDTMVLLSPAAGGSLCCMSAWSARLPSRCR